MTDYILLGQDITLPTPSLAFGDTLTLATGAGLYVPSLGLVTATAADTGVRLTLNGDLLASHIALSGFDRIAIGPVATFTASTTAVAINLNNQGGSQILNQGTITAPSATTVIEMGGGDLLLNMGTITGALGVRMGQLANDGAFNEVINSGTISTTSTTISVVSGFNHVENAGILRSLSSNAVQIQGDLNPADLGYIPTTQTLVNSGQIIARSTAAIYINLGSSDSLCQMTNTGTISAVIVAVQSEGASNDVILNRGTITGYVTLGFGGDYFDGRGGTLNGDLYMGMQNDTVDLRGATMNGFVVGGAGADTYFLSDSTVAIIEEGTETDQVFATASYRLPSLVENLFMLAAASINGFGNAEANVITGNAGDNRLTGLDGTDTITGDLGNDRISGGTGNDTLGGGDGDDTLLGAASFDSLRGDDGDDMLNGGAGRDTLTGNAGADSFVFSALAHTGNLTSTADTIADFTRGDDVIDLRSLDANINNAGSNDSFTFIGAAAFSSAAGQLRAVQTGGNTYAQMDVNGDSVADAMIRLTGLLTLNANDFLL